MNINTLLNKYKTIIWDWNGTLLNDAWLCIEIVNEILPKHNDLQLDEFNYKEVFGFPIVDYYKKIGIDFTVTSFEDITKTFIASYENKVRNSQLHKNVIDVLNTNKNNKIDQFILTAGHKESVLELLQHYLIRDFFTAVEGLDNHRAESKISKGKFLIEQHKINPKDTVLIGDTIHDLEVANQLGVDCILIANGHQSKERLETNSSSDVKVLDTIEDLLT